MGMYDELIISRKYLPEKLKEHQAGWQTKDYECTLDTLQITDDGRLVNLSREGIYNPHGKIELDYTGEINFYQNIDDGWTEFTALFKLGKMFHLTQMKPEFWDANIIVAEENSEHISRKYIVQELERINDSCFGRNDFYKELAKLIDSIKEK